MYSIRIVAILPTSRYPRGPPQRSWRVRARDNEWKSKKSVRIRVKVVEEEYVYYAHCAHIRIYSFFLTARWWWWWTCVRIRVHIQSYRLRKNMDESKFHERACWIGYSNSRYWNTIDFFGHKLSFSKQLCLCGLDTHDSWLSKTRAYTYVYIDAATLKTRTHRRIRVWLYSFHSLIIHGGMRTYSMNSRISFSKVSKKLSEMKSQSYWAVERIFSPFKIPQSWSIGFRLDRWIIHCLQIPPPDSGFPPAHPKTILQLQSFPITHQVTSSPTTA